ncbi:hypothetical protein HQ545_02625 [Candidatus Woesearchaeota archaeon]|nr:hypothetical protein [Candidatus Woesearchaeota archaeon]
MMPQKSFICVLPEYSNQEHLEDIRSEQEHESRIRYTQGAFTIEISETNSFVEDKYSLNLTTARYVVVGSEGSTKNREAMIHHHPHGHRDRHLQFKLQAAHEVIRINLDFLDHEDYIRCIKGFLSVSQKVIAHEQDENSISVDLQKHFFNQHIDGLESERQFLLGKIRQAHQSSRILDNNNDPVTPGRLVSLRSESHLLPFLDWL